MNKPLEKQECRRYDRDVDINLCKMCPQAIRGQNSGAVIGCDYPKDQLELELELCEVENG